MWHFVRFPFFSQWGRARREHRRDVIDDFLGSHGLPPKQLGVYRYSLIMKKLLFLFLVTLFQLLANAETYNVVIDGIKYELTYVNKGGSVYANAEVKSNSYSGDIVIPSSVIYNGKEFNVTSIGNAAFYGCSNLTSITIPESVTNIGSNAFQGSSNLTSITIPNSVTSIGSSAFYGCKGLTSVIIGNSVTSISNQTFYYCSSLTSVTIPNSVTSIGSYAFWKCTSLASVTIPNSVTSIGDFAFEYCIGLKKVIVPDIAAWLGITFGSGHQSNPLSYAHHLYSDEFKEIKDLVIPNSVTSIGNFAFSGCSGLTSITIPNSVTSIGSGAFRECIGLVSVIIPNSVTSIGSTAFFGCTSLASVTIPNSVTSIGSGAFYYCI